MSYLRLVPMVVWLSSCASTAPLQPSLTTSSSLPTPPPRAAAIGSPDTAPPFTAANPQEGNDQERLTQLWQNRAQERFGGEYPVGPGDVLELNVRSLNDLQNRVVRVSGEGTIKLPWIGEMQAAGFTESTLTEEIKKKLQERYMYNPQIHLFVREYHSRQVAILGAVAKPGLYNLATETDTLLDMIALAGGMTDGAAQRLNLFPGEQDTSTKDKRLASASPVGWVANAPSSLILKRTDPIVIDLEGLAKGTNQTSLALPARPGDVIIVPGAGETLVKGWVAKPGSYKITSGLTVLGAITAAGGPHFAADTASIKIIRTQKGGGKIFFATDLQKIERGETLDMPVRDGDIIDVAASTTKLVPYGFYSVINGFIRPQATVPLY
jgi:polysaccharide biosynthesis/export protein